MRYPAHGRRAVGSFLFLRWLCPALVSPTPAQFGLLAGNPTNLVRFICFLFDRLKRHLFLLTWPVPEPPTVQARRGFVLVAKSLQNLVNGVDFGDKEQYAASLTLLVIAFWSLSDLVLRWPT
jgi:hypothetical protein